jgi:hypothetical protein
MIAGLLASWHPHSISVVASKCRTKGNIGPKGKCRAKGAYEDTYATAMRQGGLLR